MEKILETQEGRLGRLIFTEDGKGIEEGKVENLIRKKCEELRKNSDEKGVIVYMPIERYNFFEKILNGDLRTISPEEHGRLLDRSESYNCEE